MKNSALGLIETYGYVGAVEAADAALKAANVSLVDLVKVRGGIMTLTLEGGVSEVRASVDAGAASAQRLGTLITSHVIPRLDEEVWSIVIPSKENPENQPDPPDDGSKLKDDEVHGEEENQEINQTDAPVTYEPSPELRDEESLKEGKNLLKEERFSEEMMQKLKVVELRKIARTIENINIEKNQIKFANKATLIKEISEAQEGRGTS